MKPSRSCSLVALISAFIVFSSSFLFSQGGSLTPPGPPAVTMKTLDEIEPRTPLDPANAPFTITAAGSYYLTGNITTLDATATPIRIEASNVTLDLRGFAIISTGGTGTSTAQSAVFVLGTGLENVRIRNGNVVGNWYAGVHATAGTNFAVEHMRVTGTNRHGITMTSSDQSRVIDCAIDGTSAAGFIDISGIAVGYSSIVENSTVSGCDGKGIAIAGGSTARGCTAVNNLNHGIDASDSCRISRCYAAINGGNGIIAFGASCHVLECAASNNDGGGISIESFGLVVHCTATGNGGRGILIGRQGTVAWCVAAENDHGIFAGGGCTVLHCNASENSGAGPGDGITAGSKSVVANNICTLNTGAGINSIGSDTRIDSNHTFENAIGIQVLGAENLIIRNSVVDSTFLHYNIAIGNYYGTIQNLTFGGPPPAVTGGGNAPSSLVTADPWANFSL